MASIDIKYKTGDEIYVKGKVQKAEVIGGKVYYKIKEATELIPQDIAYPNVTEAYVKLIPDTGYFETKVREFSRTMEKAMELANFIANLDLDVGFTTKINDESTELARITTE